MAQGVTTIAGLDLPAGHSVQDEGAKLSGGGPIVLPDGIDNQGSTGSTEPINYVDKPGITNGKATIVSPID